MAAGTRIFDEIGTDMQESFTPSVAPSGGERRIALLIPKAGWSPQRFREYWLHSHGGLIATTPGYGKFRTDYIQDHVVNNSLGLEPFPFAGVASVRLPEGDVPAFSATAVFQDRILPDEKRFLDREASVALRVRERKIRLGVGPVKCLAFGAFGEGIQDCSSLAAAHEMLPSQTPRARDIILCDVIDQPTDLSGTVSLNAPKIDWVEETRFANEREAQEHFSARLAHALAPARWAIQSHEHVLFVDNQLSQS
ncbi:EthD domain-containing protein [Leucobacter sp. Z1108]|uniref:EthD domain-containing protein n=1 Tax=Leucobacter sp. Z1108 TaxID=3439066 RepID=UPI003F2E2D6C